MFILGAGASADAGAPVMRDLGEGESDFELVFRGIHALHPLFAKSTIDINNMEAVFVAFEMAQQIGHLGDLDSRDIDRLPAAFRQVIVRTLENSIRYQPGPDRVFRPTNSYGYFAHWVNDVEPESVSVITFNYDCALDYALAFHNCRVGYGLPGSPDGRVPLAKLHGSLNWCASLNGSDSVHVYQIRALPTDPAHHHFPSVSIPFSAFAYGDLKKKLGSGATEPTIEPIIVPPTWSKGEYQRRFGQVWKMAAEQLSSADHIIVAGYSLPPTDEFFDTSSLSGPWEGAARDHYGCLIPMPHRSSTSDTGISSGQWPWRGMGWPRPASAK